MKTIRFLMLVLAISVWMVAKVNSQEPQKKGFVYTTVEQMPEYPGGINALMDFMVKTVKYPDDAKKAGITGKVHVSFVVDEKGKVQDAKIVRGVNPSLDKEALRVVNLLPEWNPGLEKGKPVKVAYTLPINFTLDGNAKTEVKKQGDVYSNVEVMPEFPGGFDALKDFLIKKVKYPDDAKKAGITGKVFVSFVVDETGKITDLKVARSVNPSLDKEALRVMNEMPVWKPGKQDGKAVKVSYTLPIQFALN